MKSYVSVPQTVQRPTATTPQGAAGALFNIIGRVDIDKIIGEVTTEIGAGANNAKLVSNPTVGADKDMCAVLDIDGATVGTVFHITGKQVNEMLAAVSGSYEAQPGSLSVPAGTIDLDCTGSTVGSIKWTVIYRAIDSGSSVVAA